MRKDVVKWILTLKNCCVWFRYVLISGLKVLWTFERWVNRSLDDHPSLVIYACPTNMLHLLDMGA